MTCCKRWICLLTLLCVAALLSACDGTTDNKTREASPSGTPQAEAEPERFQYLRYVSDVASERPRLCLVFSSALDPEVDYSAYLELDAQVALAVTGQRLCLAGLGFGASHDLRLRAGLPAADGRELERDIDATLSFADRPSLIRFAGQGVILPRRGADGVAIETVNVETVRVTVTRVNDRALAFRAITAGHAAASGEYQWTAPEAQPGEVGERIWRGEMDTPGPRNAVVTTVFPLREVLQELEPGAYHLKVENAAELNEAAPGPPVTRAARWLVHTDLAFTAYRGQDGLDVVLRSLQSAESVAGVRVELVARSNEVLATAHSDDEGRVRFAGALLRGEQGNQPRLLTAYGDDGDFAVLDLTRAAVDLSDYPVDGRARGPVDGYVYLDRGVYRPGETVRAGALIRDAAGRALQDRPATLVLTAPSGIEQQRQRFQDAPRAGSLFHDFVLPQNAARGQWQLALRVDGSGEVAARELAVEDFVPQRLALQLEADTATPLTADASRQLRARARFLYGAPGAGLPLEGSARVQADPEPFPDLSDFHFGRHDAAFDEQRFELPSGVTDDDGEGVLELEPEARGEAATQPLQITSRIAVIEPGGRAVARERTLPYRPRQQYAGVAVRGEAPHATGEPVRADAVLVDRQGALQPGRLSWQLLRHDWDHDWYRTAGGEWRWRRSQQVVPLESGELVLDGETPAAIATEALDWGDYSIVVRDGDSVRASAGFTVGWGGDTGDEVAAPDRVRVSGPSAAPEVGATAEVAFRPPYAGQAEVVVATDRVLAVTTLEVDAETTRLQLPVTEDWGAGAYILVSVFTPRDAVHQPRPRRALGITRIPVDLDAAGRRLTLDLEVPQQVAPRQRLQVPVTATGAADAERVHVTLAAVDEGILQLTGFQSPDPEAWFFGRTELGVSVLDDYGRILDPNQGRAATVRSGGDSVAADSSLVAVPQRTVALFSGPVALDQAGRGNIALELPDFNGELRLMAVAFSDTALGANDQPLTVRDRVPAELILPRFLAPDDQASATLTLDNVDGAAGRYTTTLSAGDLMNTDDPKLALELAAGERAERLVPMTATTTGIADIDLEVTGPDGFQVARHYPLEIRPAWLPASAYQRHQLAPGATHTIDTSALAAREPGSARLAVNISTTPIDVAAIYQALRDRRAHGVEQQVSQALPRVHAAALETLTGVPAADEAGSEVQATIEAVLALQGGNGVFGRWRVGDGQASPWLGAWFTDFLSQARGAGHSVPEAALQRALAALKPIAAGEPWRSQGYRSGVAESDWHDDTRERLRLRSAAYASLVLARHGEADRSRLRYLHDEQLEAIDSPLARAQVGAALASLGDRARAASAMDAAVAALGYQNSGDPYQSRWRDLAGVLGLAAEAGFSERVASLVERLQAELPAPTALNDQELAFLLLAARSLAGDPDAVEVQHDGEPLEQRTLVFTADSADAAGTLTNAGTQPLWVSELTHGTTREPPAAASSGVSLEKRYFDLSGQPVDPERMERGQRLVVALTLRPTRTTRLPMQVTDLLPAGFEIEAVLPADAAGEDGRFAWLGELARPRAAEARHDRFVAALQLDERKDYRLAYLVRAVTPGDFALPGAAAEHPQKPEVHARTAPARVLIEP